VRLNLTSFSAVAALATLTALSPPLLAQGTPAAPTTPASPAKIAEAKKHMAAGAAFYNDPAGHKCEEAIREFSKAYELSGSLNALKGMAVCNLELERDGDAIEQYTAFLAGKGSVLDPVEKQQVEADLNALRSAVAHVTFNANRPGVRITDVRTPARGFPITNRYDLSTPGKKIGIHPGQHVFTASAEGAPDQVWQVEISNGSKYDHTFDFNAKPGDAGKSNEKDMTGQGPDQVAVTRPVPEVVYAFGGLTVVTAGVTVGLMVWARGKNTAYAEKNGKATEAELQDLRSGVKTANLIADIGIGVTAASAVATIVLFATRPTKKVAPKASRWMVAPIVAQGGGGAVLTGVF
jgi:hypothetical protein